MRRSASARIIGWSRRSSACFAAGSENTCSLIASRSIAPRAVMNASPNNPLMCGSAAPPASVSSRAIASVSTTVAPRRANSSAAALLPVPMPPVRPTTNMSQPIEIPAQDRLAPKEANERGDGDVGSEVKAEAGVPLAARREHLQRTEGEADDRGEQDHERQHFPAEECADRGVHLEVAVAHAFLAGRELEAPVNEPEHEVARYGADHRVGQRHERAANVHDQANPNQPQREIVRQ